MIRYPLILLAGGESTRMGQPKGLLDFHGHPWLEEQVNRFRNLGGEKIVVVMGYHHDAYLSQMPHLKTCSIINPNPERGAFTSLQTGAGAVLNRGNDAAFLLPVDVPCPDISVWKALQEHFDSKTSACLPRWQNHGGHPGLLSSNFLSKMLKIAWQDPDARLDKQLKALPDNRIRRVFVTDPNIRLNLNTKSAWNKYVRTHNSL